ncbi:hypothetical protein [Proteiniphilum acetatigenes]|uniref:hypothetical protein n=1 Tax=Proteiniphilum acetatigenes TaxID=294710 RepID=UPI00037E0924|nr:hypothetical protein [Proteiniphilum acetatigenes]SFK31663.1 hypothetical protein SAMN05216357_101283 [Porphyromonadaceae bacterium KH3CP3RA]
MQHEDYIIREIGKFGLIISAVRNMLFGGRDNPAITIENKVDEAKGMLLNEINFDLDMFLHLNGEKTSEYLSRFEGFNIENTESLAKVITEIGFNTQSGNATKYLEKALQLYRFCNLKDNTYSIERETNITAIKNELQQGN